MLAEPCQPKLKRNLPNETPLPTPPKGIAKAIKLIIGPKCGFGIYS